MRFKKLLFVFMFVIRLTAGIEENEDEYEDDDFGMNTESAKEEIEFLDALSGTYDLELGYVKGSTSTDRFSQFYSDISAVSRILNSLSLEMELHDRSVSVVEVLIELTKSGIPLDLMNKLKRGNFKDLESKVQDLASKMSSLNGVGAWNTVKIRHGLDIVEELKGNVSGAAGNLNSQKIEEMLGVIEKVRQANYTLLDSDPISHLKQVLEYISSKDSISDADAEEFSKQMFALKKLLPIVEETAKLFVSGESLFNELYTVTEVDANKKSFDPLFEISDILKDNFTDSGALTALSTEFASFESVHSQLSSLEDPITKISGGLVDIRELVLRIFSTPVVFNKTSGFVNGLEDLDSVFTDLKLKRMESLIGGGKSLKMLEGHIQWINSLKETFRNIETIWKTIHKKRDLFSKDFTQLSDVEVKIKSFNSDLGSISTEISDLNEFLKSPDAVFQLSKTGKLDGFQSKIGTFYADIEKAHTVFNTLSVSQSHIAVLSNLTSLKSIFSVEKLDSVRLADLKKQNLTSVLAALTSLKKLLVSNKAKPQFSQLQQNSIALSNQAQDVRIMKEWANGVKNFKRPQSLFQSLTTAQTVLAEVSATEKSISSIQEAVSETGKSVEAVKAMESSPKSEVSESTWKELIPLSKTIGDTAQCASMLSSKNGIVEKMGKLKNAGEELDATLKTSKDQKAVGEIRKFWKGYSSLDSEIQTILAQVEKFQKNVPSTEDVTTLETYAPVIRVMEDVHFQTTNIQDVVVSIQQFKGTISDSALAETVSKLRAELVQCPVLEYSQYSKSLKLAPDALHSVMNFFSNLFDFSLETIHSTTASPNPTSFLPFIGYGSLVCAFVVLIIGIALWWFGCCCACCYKPKPIDKKDEIKRKRGSGKSKTKKVSNDTSSTSNSNSAEVRPQKPRGAPSSSKTARKRKGSKRAESSVNSAASLLPDTTKSQKKKEKSKTETTEEPRTAIVGVAANSKGRVSKKNSKAGGSCKTANEPSKKIIKIPPKVPSKVPSKVKEESYHVPINVKFNHAVFNRLVRNFRGSYVALENKKKTLQPAIPVRKWYHRQKACLQVYWDVNLKNELDINAQGKQVVDLGKGCNRGSGAKRHYPDDYLFKTFISLTDEFYIFPPYKPEDLAVFLLTIYNQGLVVVNGFDSYDNISSGGANRFWPVEQGVQIVVGDFTVKMIEEERGDVVYYARLEIISNKYPDKVTTLFLHILTSEWNEGLIKVSDAVDFYKKTNGAMILTQGNVVFYGDEIKSLTFIAIIDCFVQLCKIRNDPDRSLDLIYSNFFNVFQRPEQFELIFLTLADLIKETLEKQYEYSWITAAKAAYETRRQNLQPLPLDITQNDGDE